MGFRSCLASIFRSSKTSAPVARTDDPGEVVLTLGKPWSPPEVLVKREHTFPPEPWELGPDPEPPPADR